MPWFKIDDAFHGHPKVMELSPAAVGIWTLSGTWCANYLTDGEIKPSVVRRLGGTPELIQELVEAGLWIDNGDSYQFKDWDDYQPMKADVEAEREAARERMRSARAKKKGIETSPVVQPNTSRTFEGTSSEVRVTPSLPVPSQPIPSSSETEKKKTATRLSKDWAPTASHIEKAREKNIDLLQQAEFFKLHAETHDRKAVNWNAAFTTWLTKAKPGPSQPSGGQLNVDAILGRDLWTPPAPPDDLPDHEYKAWLIRVRREHDQARYAEAQKRATA